MDADAGTPARNHSRLPRGTIVLLTTAGVVAVVAGLHEIAGIIAPIFLALVLTVAVHPLDGCCADGEQGRGPRWCSRSPRST